MTGRQACRPNPRADCADVVGLIPQRPELRGGGGEGSADVAVAEPPEHRIDPRRLFAYVPRQVCPGAACGQGECAGRGIREVIVRVRGVVDAVLSAPRRPAFEIQEFCREAGMVEEFRRRW